ncbi:MAG: Yip1 family protein [Gammaproteobacteria bacterium]
MKLILTPMLILRLLFKPQEVFNSLSHTRPSAGGVFFGVAVWLIALPPVFAYIGSVNFGWRLGVGEPLMLPAGTLVLISLAYFLLILIGFFVTALLSRWMSYEYGARHSIGIHFAMITVVGTPLVVGSLVHLYPHAFINVLVLVPTVMWSSYILYKGLPIVLQTTPEQGMLMASSLIGFLLVAYVSLLGITVMLWGSGIGPSVGI